MPATTVVGEHCRDQTGAAVIAVPLTNLGEPTVAPLSGLPHIVIDIPR